MGRKWERTLPAFRALPGLCAEFPRAGEEKGDFSLDFLRRLWYDATENAPAPVFVRLPGCPVRAKKRARGGFNQKEEKTMAVISMKQLLEAGVHFGHQTRRWNPK
ncbi:MAG: hypothetical protein MR821_07035, partial [Clostridiales bacterium]|nr:hypothetical protein [Clostridiales bacterium]